MIKAGRGAQGLGGVFVTEDIHKLVENVYCPAFTPTHYLQNAA